MQSSQKGKTGSMAVKLTCFLKAMLLRLGFGEKLTRLLMVCVQTVSYSVVVNGKPGKNYTI